MELEVNITGPHYRDVSSALAEWHIILTGRATNFDMGSFCSSLLFFSKEKKLCTIITRQTWYTNREM